MLKNTLILFCFLMVVLSCKKEDDSIDCLEKQGDMRTMINDEILFDALIVSYVEFGVDNNLPDKTIAIGALVFDNLCEQRASLGLRIKNELGRKELGKTNSENRLAPTTSIFFESSDDATIGEWDVYEQEDGWVELDEIGEGFVKGRFSVTYLIDENPNNFQNLPDTLRLKNVSFEAVLNATITN